jgi:hypothetical protein
MDTLHHHRSHDTTTTTTTNTDKRRLCLADGREEPRPHRTTESDLCLYSPAITLQTSLTDGRTQEQLLEQIDTSPSDTDKGRLCHHHPAQDGHRPYTTSRRELSPLSPAITADQEPPLPTAFNVYYVYSLYKVYTDKARLCHHWRQLMDTSCRWTPPRDRSSSLEPHTLQAYSLPSLQEGDHCLAALPKMDGQHQEQTPFPAIGRTPPRTTNGHTEHRQEPFLSCLALPSTRERTLSLIDGLTANAKC